MRHTRFTEKSSLGTLFEHAADKLPEGRVTVAEPSPILGSGRQTFDYGGLAAVVEEVSGWFPLLGVRPGRHVVVAKANHPDIVVLAAAASRAGAVPALVSGTVPGPDARVLLDRLDPAAVISDTATVEAWGLTGDDPWPVLVVDAEDGALPRARRLVSADQVRGSAPSPVRPPAFTSPMVVTHTSGTTGVPKLVQHSAATVSTRARMVTVPVPVLSIRRRDRYAAYLPWAHARAVEFFTSSLHISCPVLALSDPDPASAEGLLGPFRPTVFESVPNVFLLWEQVAERSRHLFRSMRAYLNAFDAMHPRTVRAFLDAAPRRTLWLQGYGQSEVGCVTVDAYTRRTVRRDGDVPPTLRSMGWASPPITNIRVRDPETGAKVPRGHVGQLEVRTGGRVLTYVGQEDLHARRLRDGGRWWTTGDLGYLTRSGRTVLQDRHVDTIEGIDSCLELEDRLLDEVPEATEVVIVSVDGRAVPVVCTVDDAPLDGDRWRRTTAGLAGRLADPVHLPWDDVPRTGTYKVRRHVLVDDLRTRLATAAAGAADAPDPGQNGVSISPPAVHGAVTEP